MSGTDSAPTEVCNHDTRVDGVCSACGHCDHAMILNGACYFCGTEDLQRARSAGANTGESLIPIGRLLASKPAKVGEGDY